MRWFLAIALLMSGTAWADVVLSIGPGKGAFSSPGTPFERAVAVGYQWSFDKDFFVRPEAGYFISGGNGQSSLWVAPIFGFRALSKIGTELHVGAGPGYLQNPDDVLGGPFQFSLEGGIGIADKNVYVGVDWKHISSGPFYKVNRGRDFLVVQVRLLKF